MSNEEWNRDGNKQDYGYEQPSTDQWNSYQQQNQEGFQQGAGYGAYQQGQPQYNGNGQMPNQGSNGFATAALVLGILSLVLFCTGFNIILAILAIIFGGISLKKTSKRGMSITGIVTGIVSIVLFILMAVIIGVSMLSVFTESGMDLDELYDYYQHQDEIRYDGNVDSVHYEYDLDADQVSVYFE